MQGGKTDMRGDEHQLNDGRRDMERAIADLADRLPRPLQALARLAYNYRWSWLSGGADLFSEIDPPEWRRTWNPRAVIEAASPRHLDGLATQASFTARAAELAAQLDDDLARPWAATAIRPEAPVAYFCSEYGLHSSLPIYGGGLGVLAGDTLKAASDLALPMVGVGLLCKEGYFHQRLDPAGWQHEYWVTTEFDRLPAVLVTGADEAPLTVDVVIRGRPVHVQMWRLDIGRVPLYLLDTDRDDNHPIDRWITARLYVGDRHTRLAQYAVLGIGGARALQALGIAPAIVHLNEGHAALRGLERIRELCAAGQSFDEAVAAVRRQTVFTTHTPIPAGNEGYSREEVDFVLGDFIRSLAVPPETLYALGRVTPSNEHESVSITPLALRTSHAANGVSRRHGEVARSMWQGLWPERPVDAVPIRHVTNGVHTATWMSVHMQALLDRYLSPAWRTRLTEQALWDGIGSIPDAELWRVRCTLRQELVDFVRGQSIRDRITRGEPADYVDAAARVFDPTVLTIGFARRIAQYKRIYLIGRLPDQGIVRLLADGPTPVQLVLAGKAHPQDHEAKMILRDGFQFKGYPAVGRRVVFLEDYDLRMARRVVAGVDVWLNLPRPPLEASGTSGMKVALNGGLNLSVLDGWWAEAYDGLNGWAITSPDADPHAQDEHDARALLALLEHEIIPLFYDRDADGIPHRWLQRIKTALRSLTPQFTAERMLREYVSTMYTAGVS